MHILAACPQRVDAGDFGPRKAFQQIFLCIIIHHETDRAEIHAVDLGACGHGRVQRVQHQAIAAQRDNNVGIVDGVGAITLLQALAGGFGFRLGAGEKG